MPKSKKPITVPPSGLRTFRKVVERAYASTIGYEYQRYQAAANLLAQYAEKNGATRAWSWKYIQNVYTGRQEPSRALLMAAKKAQAAYEYAEGKKNDLRLRPIQVRCTQAEYDEIVGSAMTTSERAEWLLLGVDAKLAE